MAGRIIILGDDRRRNRSRAEQRDIIIRVHAVGAPGPFSHSSRDVYESRPPALAVFQHDFEISAALLDVV